MNALQQALQHALKRRDETQTRRTLSSITRDGPYLWRNGTQLLDVSSNDYLGLADHPIVKQRAAEWAERYGAGARASRLVTGTLALHHHIEERLATFKSSEAALLFASGWQANASIIPALSALSRQETGAPAQFYMDRLNHASLHHGCLSAGVHQKRFRHNDLTHLEELLSRDKDTTGLRFIVTESVFSMDGDQADIPALRALADHFGAFLYIDEAHATGVLGPEGRGLGHGLSDITMSTASKALGGMGAFVTGSRALCDYLLNQASGFIYSTALPPALLGAIDAALDLIPTLEQERHTLHAHASKLRKRLHLIGRSTSTSTTQIIPVIIGESDQALSIAKMLEHAGFLVAAIRPPTVPPHTARLRIALNSQISAADIDRLGDALLKYCSLENP
ncbi:aminotransferase class I/II-fold pyridoxal phosphate-dependent enzyme [Saccharibacter sp. 17.LH.SD]|uniref:aminotransferase class I/II-fold pyridoxal phosphate-dependent enzyme n=1 Tax=Saccharibacter sp. 17.LH.SD TaxID=2689393 RepID=UPI001367AAA2|nr:8-amino-7-oxononanoate synthase [Saccharibacter sp. 17.LH.SD]MXV43691.1 aminotransferase class I/II-fold pyridoxal phosphate-dependent enzyme [Saccharibacter sp. 17.LH.SD]